MWQVDDPQQNYSSTCFTLLAPYIDMVQGFTRDNGTLEAGVPHQGGWIAVVASDQYGLEGGDRWNNSTGSLLWFGNGSQAVFAGNEIELNTTIDATTCLNAGSFWIEPFPTPCTSAQYITNNVGPGPGQALTSYSPDPPYGQLGDGRNQQPIAGQRPRPDGRVVQQQVEHRNVVHVNAHGALLVRLTALLRDLKLVRKPPALRRRRAGRSRP